MVHLSVYLFQNNRGSLSVMIWAVLTQADKIQLSNGEEQNLDLDSSHFTQSC